MAYWLDVFSVESWNEFSAAGRQVAGFPAGKWPSVKKIRLGDRLLVYLQGAKIWVAVLEVVGEPFFSDDPPIWSARSYPARVEVRLRVGLAPTCGVRMEQLLPFLQKFEHMRGAEYTGSGGFFMSPPTLWSDEDGLVVETAIRRAAHHI